MFLNPFTPKESDVSEADVSKMLAVSKNLNFFTCLFSKVVVIF